MLRDLPLFIAVLLGAASAGPCDIYKGAEKPCVAAHSTVRALFDNYNHSLYQLTRASDKKTHQIKPLIPGGIANAAAHDKFCQDTSCVFSIIYDQSGKKNHLTAAPGGGANNKPDRPADASRLPIKIGQHKAYGVWIEPGVGYRNDHTNGIPKGDDAEAIYMIVDGTNYNDKCCFDYGNAETNNKDDGPGTMEALYFGNNNFWSHGRDSGPWVMADLEDGLFGCGHNGTCSNIPSVKSKYLVAMLKGRSGGTFALKQGDAQTGLLQTIYDGRRPDKYLVMKKQGAIILAIGGDNSNWAVGSFFEGVIAKGDPTDETDNHIQENIVSAGYGK